MAKQTRSITTIAKIAGVSTTTVHRALVGKSEISPETRARVREVAEQIDYRPSLVARCLVTGRSATIGVVMPGVHGSFFSEVIIGVGHTAATAGYNILIGFSQDSFSEEQEQVDLLLQRAVDGIIVIPCGGEESVLLYRELADEGVTLVFVMRSLPGVEVDLVSGDNVQGGYLAGRHLAGLGRKNVVYLAGVPRALQGTSRQGRIVGCNQALAEAGLEPVAVLWSRTGANGQADHYGYQAVSDYLKSGQRLDAFFARDDLMACGAMAALYDSGVRVPEDVSVVGFDDQEIAAYVRPALTTVRQPMRQIGAEAMRLLLRRIEEEGEKTDLGQEILLPPELVVRDSCGGGRQSNKSDDTNTVTEYG